MARTFWFIKILSFTCPFGMMMPNRTYSAQTSYRYGFNGKENDSEVRGEGNELDYGMRVYDTRLGRFLSVDPLTKNYPWYTPYQYAGNRPIQCIDLDGLEPLSMITAKGKVTMPVMRLLEAAFNFSQQTIENTDWINYKEGTKAQRAYAKGVGVGKGVTATTISETVIHDGNQNRSDGDWLGLIAHEQTHREQIDHAGGGMLGSVSVGERIWTETSDGRKPTETSVEQQAYLVGGNWSGYDYVDDLLKFQNGAVMKILNDDKRTDLNKEIALSLVGSQFRRDVLLPKWIKQVEGEIEIIEIGLNMPGVKYTSEQKTLYQNALKTLKGRLEGYKREMADSAPQETKKPVRKFKG